MSVPEQLALTKLIDLRAPDAADFDLRRKFPRLLIQRGGDHDAVADGGVEFVRDSRDDTSQCCQLFAADQFVLRPAEVFQRLLQLMGPFGDTLLQLRIEVANLSPVRGAAR